MSTQSAASGSWRQTVERWLLAIWFPEGQAGKLRWVTRALGAVLIPLSWLTGWYSRRQRRAIVIDRRRQTVPVLVVGNLTVGGAGKTPIVIELVQQLSQRGMLPAVLASGYRGRTSVEQPQLVVPTSDAHAVGDEALMIAQQTGVPVAAGRERSAALRMLLSRHPECRVVVSDDGLQHRALVRRLQIAVFDQRGAGNGRLLPAGPLREPLAHAAQMDAVLLSQGAGDPVKHPRTYRYRVQPLGFKQLGSANLLSCAEFADRHRSSVITAVAGIGQPQRFFDLLASLNLKFERLALADHEPVPNKLLHSLQGRLIITTAKDAVKWPHTDDQDRDQQPWVLEIRSEIDPAFFNWLSEQLRG